MRWCIGFFSLLCVTWMPGCASEHPYIPLVTGASVPTSLVTITPSGSYPASPYHPCIRDLADKMLKNDLEELAKVWTRIISQSAYPEIARINRWQGRVQLCVDVSQSGMIEDVSLYAGSGNKFLDEEALRTSRSVGSVELSHPLSQAHMRMEVSINYSPEKTGFLQQLMADALWQQVSAKSTYPSEAVEAKLQGKVVLRVPLQSDGNAGRIDLLESSGSPILDQAAVISVNQAIPLGFVLRKQPLPATFILPILYSLDPAP
ncbi:MAG: TonB family protein [Nitrospira sp.]|nr:TonB family protein [Nitrospira sp.]